MPKKIHCNEIKQRSPIVYIFVGEIDEGIKDGIKHIHKKRVGAGGIGYITAYPQNTREEIVSEVNLLRREFIKNTYSAAGEIKLNYVVSADNADGLFLATVKSWLNEHFKLLYPAAIATDVFLLLDDVNVSPNEHRNAVLKIADEMGMQDSAMVYILSNLNNSGIYNEESKLNIINSIALIALFKEYASPQPDGTTRYIYNEHFFKEDCFRQGNGGKFATLGHYKLKKPMGLIKKIVLTKLLLLMQNGKGFDGGFDPTINTTSNQLNLTLDDLLALPLNRTISAGEKTSMSNMGALQALFGKRLDLFYKVNEQSQADNVLVELKKYFEEAVCSVNVGFFKTFDETSPDGALTKRLLQMLDELKYAAKIAEAQFESWKGQPISDNGKISLSVLTSIQAFPYKLAEKYLKFKHTLSSYKHQINQLEKAIEEVKQFHFKLALTKQKIDEIVSRYNKEIDETEEKLMPMQSSVRKFYEAALIDCIGESMTEFLNIYSSLFNLSEEGKFSLFIEKLETFVEENVFKKHTAFQKPFAESTAQILCFNSEAQTDDEAYRLIFDEIVAGKTFNVFLKTGMSRLHCEINVMLGTESKLAHTIRSGAASCANKVNIFYEAEKEIGDVDIIYHAGGFSQEDLYYNELFPEKLNGDRHGR